MASPAVWRVSRARLGPVQFGREGGKSSPRCKVCFLPRRGAYLESRLPRAGNNLKGRQTGSGRCAGQCRGELALQGGQTRRGATDAAGQSSSLALRNKRTARLDQR